MAHPFRPASLLAPVCCLLLASASLIAAPAAKPKPYRLPSVDLKQQIIWGATCEGLDGTGLAFGGQNQIADDGRSLTRVLREGKWISISEQIRHQDDLAEYHARMTTLADRCKVLSATARAIYFQGLPATETRNLMLQKLAPAFQQTSDDFAKLAEDLRKRQAEPQSASQRLASAAFMVDFVAKEFSSMKQILSSEQSKSVLKLLQETQAGRELAADALSAEPRARALSPIVFDAKTGLYVLFGGDHCDYVTNDTWTFDPMPQTWTRRTPKAAPPPRANHVLVADGNGRVRLTGGYKYANNTDYTGGQYVDRGDGEWVFDIAGDTWTSAAGAVGSPPNEREYRTGVFQPDYFLQNPAPDAAAFQKRLADLPPNEWMSIKPPHLPQMNRDWGTAVLDPDRDMILRFAGGHSAHGGTDVLHFHLATGRWELPFPVEFPLGQTYVNTEYPAGWNFNRRPWVTGHTYQSYGYDPLLKQMVFTGQKSHSYFYDPTRADWVSRSLKPKGMDHGDCYYDLTICPTPKGLACWTKDGAIFRFEAEQKQWVRLPVTGTKLPGSSVDNSTVAYDSKRNRLLMLRKPYGDKHVFEGKVYALDLNTLEAGQIDPPNARAAAAVPYLCQFRYDPSHDLLLGGCTLPPDESGIRRTPAFDCASNEWVSFQIGGDDPSGKKGRDVSLGLVHDPKRNLFWTVDAKSNVTVLRFDPDQADRRVMRE